MKYSKIQPIPKVNPNYLNSRIFYQKFSVFLILKALFTIKTSIYGKKSTEIQGLAVGFAKLNVVLYLQLGSLGILLESTDLVPLRPGTRIT